VGFQRGKQDGRQPAGGSHRDSFTYIDLLRGGGRDYICERDLSLSLSPCVGIHARWITFNWSPLRIDLTVSFPERHRLLAHGGGRGKRKRERERDREKRAALSCSSSRCSSTSRLCHAARRPERRFSAQVRRARTSCLALGRRWRIVRLIINNLRARRPRMAAWPPRRSRIIREA